MQVQTTVAGRILSLSVRSGGRIRKGDLIATSLHRPGRDGWIGVLMAFQVSPSVSLQPVNNLVALGATIQELQSQLERLDDGLDSPPRKA